MLYSLKRINPGYPGIGTGVDRLSDPTALSARDISSAVCTDLTFNLGVLMFSDVLVDAEAIGADFSHKLWQSTLACVCNLQIRV
ncbi:hypothetical protein PoB_005050900 [Plakobranchus ocellatus]|uniref:Uncharacterized protein n=1 Tax=Plakobranchus ocellatus TaxID=259542 RepID=A0AAV4BUX8_9GAST|nr:hypothetical protein PoB_005050900 [Plakobranchus ocellatus]